MSSDTSRPLHRVTSLPAFKLFLIGVIVVLLLIPLAMVFALVAEREGRASAARDEVAASWGTNQQIRGVVLVVPFSERYSEIVEGKTTVREVHREAVFLPEKLDIGGKVRSKTLHRSIYDIAVYNADLTLSGRFAAPDLALIAPNAVDVRWQDAVFAILIYNVSGIKQMAELTIDGQAKLPFQPSIGTSSGTHPGMHVRLFPTGATVDKVPAFEFSTTLGFAGSGSLYFPPAGRETSVKIESDWPHPSFRGAFLPDNREISANGFTADWHVPQLARSVPQSWVANTVNRGNHTSDGLPLDQFGMTVFGVEFVIPLDYFDLIARALKYGIMFVASAFAAVFVMELLSGKRVDGVQYFFVGFAMVFFYVLLLSFSEHIGFTRAYLIAATATGGMLSLYLGKILASTRQGLLAAFMFAVIYGFLYMILRLEDYALIAGALLGFVLMTATMFLTLRIDWSGRATVQEPEQ